MLLNTDDIVQEDLMDEMTFEVFENLQGRQDRASVKAET